MGKVATLAASIVLLISLAPGAYAQRSARQTRQRDAELRALREEVEALRQEQRAMREELQEIKRLLEEIAKNTAPRQRTVSVDDDPALGESTAKVVLIDFSDYQ